MENSTKETIMDLLKDIRKQKKEIVENSFYDAVKSKTMWNKVSNNYIKPTIKKLHPRYNSEVKLEIVS